MKTFQQICDQYEDYPCNIVHTVTLNRVRKTLHERLQVEGKRLFGSEGPTASGLRLRDAVDFLDIDYDQSRSDKSVRITAANKYRTKIEKCGGFEKLRESYAAGFAKRMS